MGSLIQSDVPIKFTVLYAVYSPQAFIKRKKIPVYAPQFAKEEKRRQWGIIITHINFGLYLEFIFILIS